MRMLSCGRPNQEETLLAYPRASGIMCPTWTKEPPDPPVSAG